MAYVNVQPLMPAAPAGLVPHGITGPLHVISDSFEAARDLVTSPRESSYLKIFGTVVSSCTASALVFMSVKQRHTAEATVVEAVTSLEHIMVRAQGIHVPLGARMPLCFGPTFGEGTCAQARADAADATALASDAATTLASQELSTEIVGMVVVLVLIVSKMTQVLRPAPAAAVVAPVDAPVEVEDEALLAPDLGSGAA